MLYDRNAQLHTLALDFDVSLADRGLVARDAAEALQLLSEAGLAPWADLAPTGGRHVYARLPHPVPAPQIARLAAALSARWATLDVTPLLNPTGGCLRPPGAVHKAGGHQRLTSPVAHVARAVAATPPTDTWPQLWRLTRADQVQALPPRSEIDVTPDPLPGIARRAVAARWEAIARGAPHPYPSPSEARMAVIGGCVRAGWSLNDLEAAISGPWAQAPIARHLQVKYGIHWRSRIAAEFDKARKNHLNARLHRSVRISDTRPGTTRGGSPTPLPGAANPHIELRKFCSFTTDYARRNHLTPTQRSVLRAAIWVGLVQGRAVINAGCRAMAEQANCCPDTVASTLHTLAGHGLVERVREGRGVDADLWQLNTHLGRDHRPVKGKILGQHPVFRVIGGHRTGEVWQELHRSTSPVTADTLGTTLGYDRQRISEELRLLAGWGLAQRADNGWQLGDTDADQLADRIGGHEHQQAQHARHVAQRAAWHRALLHRGEHIPVAGQLSWEDLLAVAAPHPDTWIREFASGTPPPSTQRPAQAN